MELKLGIWHVVPGCEPSKITTVTDLWRFFPKVFGAELQGRLTCASNRIVIPLDNRIHHTPGKRASAHSQERQFDWTKWVRAMLISSASRGTGLMAIFIYLPGTRQLELYGHLRRVNEGVFARRLVGESQQIFVLSEEPVMLKSIGVYGGNDSPTRQMPEKIDLY